MDIKKLFREKDAAFWVLFLIIATTIFKGLVWVAVVPLWHAPDEAAHFSTLQKLAERIDVSNLPPGFGASAEIQITERFLETERGDDGTTAFTFRPDYKIQYSTTEEGIFEKEIKSIPDEFRKQPVRHEQAFYPPLYYLVGGVFYNTVYNSDIILRAFTVRLFSILTIVGIVVVSFFLAKEIFPQKKYLQAALPIIVSFQPMLTFVSAGINSDNLANFQFSLFLLVGVLAITRGLEIKKTAILGVLVGLGFLIKPQFIIALALASGLIFYELVRTRKILSFVRSIIVFSILMIVSGGFIPIQEALANLAESGQVLPYVETAKIANPENQLSFSQHLINTFHQTIAQTIPWYWGVFKWLSLTLPRLVNQILMRVMFVGAIGLVVKVFLEIKNRNFDRVNQALLFLAISAVIFFGAVIFRDWQHIRSFIFSLGIQGRYFFPVILAHLSLLLVGILTLIPESLKKITAFILVLGSVILNFVALYTLSAHSYNLTSVARVIVEASQYKPWYFKGEILIGIFSIYFILLILLLLAVIRLYLKNSK